MSEENVEIVRESIEAYNRRDLDTVLEACDPEVEWHAAFRVMLGGEATVCNGRDDVRHYLREVDEAFVEIHIQLDEFRDLGERIVAIGRARSRGRASGAEIVSPVSFLAEFRNGRIFRMTDYLGSGALKAAGLRE